MVFEVLVVAAAVIIAMVLLRRPADKVAAAASPAEDPPRQAIARVLKVEGTVEVPGSRSFVKTFGLTPREVIDLRVFKGAASLLSLPPMVAKCLAKTYAEGTARGLDVAQLVNAERALAADEGLYFALVARGRGQDSVVSFVAKA